MINGNQGGFADGVRVKRSGRDGTVVAVKDLQETRWALRAWRRLDSGLTDD